MSRVWCGHEGRFRPLQGAEKGKWRRADFSFLLEWYLNCLKSISVLLGRNGMMWSEVQVQDIGRNLAPVMIPLALASLSFWSQLLPVSVSPPPRPVGGSNTSQPESFRCSWSPISKHASQCPNSIILYFIYNPAAITQMPFASFTSFIRTSSWVKVNKETRWEVHMGEIYSLST